MYGSHHLDFCLAPTYFSVEKLFLVPKNKFPTRMNNENTGKQFMRYVFT